MAPVPVAAFDPVGMAENEAGTPALSLWLYFFAHPVVSPIEAWLSIAIIEWRNGLRVVFTSLCLTCAAGRRPLLRWRLMMGPGRAAGGGGDLLILCLMRQDRAAVPVVAGTPLPPQHYRAATRDTRRTK